MVQKDTLPKAMIYAEENIDLNLIAEDVVEVVSTPDMASDEAEARAHKQVESVLEGTADHLIEDVKEDVGWQAGKKAKRLFIEEQVSDK